MKKSSVHRLTVALLGVGAALAVAAGTDSPFAANMSVNYQPPGARSQAMGGAFIGLADDATAATVNPAGLVQLSKPEIMGQFNSGTSGLDLHNFRGVYAEATGPGYSGSQVINNDLAGSVQNGNFQGLTYISFVYPTKYGVFALNYSQPVNFHAYGNTVGQLYTSAYYTCSICSPNYTSVTDNPKGFYGRLRDDRFSLSYAVRVGKGFSLGITASHNRISQNFATYNYATSNRVYPSNLFYTLNETSADSGLSFTGGLLWKVNEKFQAGLSYQRGFSYGGRVVLTRTSPYAQIRDDAFATETRLPDQYGLGLVWRPIPIFVISLDIDRTRYSSLANGLRTFNQRDIDLTDAAYDPAAGNYASSFTVNDATEPHLGVEYVALIGGAPAIFRAGLWQEKRHGLRYAPDSHYFIQDPADPNPYPDAAAYNRFAQKVMGNRFPGGDDQLHYSAGIGMVLAQKVQLDMGYDYSRLSKQFVMSAIYRFGHK